MRSKIVLGLALTTCLTAPAAAETWHSIHAADDAIAYADADNVSPGSWVRLNLFVSYESGDYHKWSIYLNCTKKEVRMNSAADYGADRKYLSSPPIDREWQDLSNPIFAAAKEFGCDGSYREDPVSDPFTDADEYWYYYYSDSNS